MIRFVLASFFATSLFVGALNAADAPPAPQPDLKEILERMKKLEGQVGQLQKENSALKSKDATEKTADKYIAAKGVSEITHDPELHPRKIVIGGGIDFTYQFNFNRPKANLGTLASFSAFGIPGATLPSTQYGNGAFNGRVFGAGNNNSFELNLAEISFDSLATKCGEVGFRVDLDWGTDKANGKFTLADSRSQNNTLLGQSDSTGNIQQAYINYIVPLGNGINVAAGKFVTPYGFETIEAWDNWNATRSLSFEHAIPFTHTGISAKYDLNCRWSVGAYLVNDIFSGDQPLDQNDEKSFIFTATYKPKSWITWNSEIGYGDEGSLGSEDGNVVYLGNNALGGVSTNGSVFKVRKNNQHVFLANTNILFSPWCKWDFALDATYGWKQNGDARPSASDINFRNNGLTTVPFGHRDDAAWMSAAAYAKYKFLKSWYLALRGEFFYDQNGALNVFPAHDDPFGSIKSKLYSFTATVNWAVAQNANIRFEYRHDGADDDVFTRRNDTFAPGTTGAFTGFPSPAHGRFTQDTATVQFTIKW